MDVLRWIGKNFSSLLLAFALALVVWVSAVTASDPNQEQVFTRPINLEVRNQDPNLIIMNSDSLPATMRVWLNAPRSRWNAMTSATDQPIEAWIDLADLEAGEHSVPVQVRVNPIYSPVRIVQRTPSEVHVILESKVTRTFDVNLSIEGVPLLGYQAGTPTFEPDSVVIEGAASLVSRVSEVRAFLDITGAHQSIETPLQLFPYDENGNLVEEEDLHINPDRIEVSQPINLLGGYRNVIVKVVYAGQLADGYKLTNITVLPPSVVVFSSDLELLGQLPGYIETEPLDLDNVADDVEAFLDLNVPEGIEVPGDQKVLVQVSVAAIESNLALSLPVDVVGLSRGLTAQVAPTTVDIIFSGPLPVLNTLRPNNIRVYVDVTGREVGTYQIPPNVNFLPDRVQIDTILPTALEVAISVAPTPTPTSLPTPELTTTPGSNP
jgi:YbbR domain-containing protein